MAKPKPCPYHIIDRKKNADGTASMCYEIMDDLIDKHHAELAAAKIALAWRFGWKEDKDGKLILGKCIKCPAVHREMHGFDFVICLNHESVNKAGFTRNQLTALIDHELCHSAPSLDANGDQKEDADGNLQWRCKKHDIEEFRCIVERHGCYKADLEDFAQVAAQKVKEPLLPIEAAMKEPTIRLTTADGKSTGDVPQSMFKAALDLVKKGKAS